MTIDIDDDWTRHLVDAAPAPFLRAGELDQVGRFLAAAAPWFRLGANCLPADLATKAPLVCGWGANGLHKFKLARAHGLGDHALHGVDSPKLPASQYVDWAAGAFRDVNCLVMPANIGCIVVDVDDLKMLPQVIRACGDTPYRTISGRADGGLHLWYYGTHKSESGITPGVDVKSSRGYVIAPGSLHARTGNEYGASDALRAVLQDGVPFDPPIIRLGWAERLAHAASAIIVPTRLDLGTVVDQLSANKRTRAVSACLRKVLAGQEFAEAGEMDTTLYAVLCALGSVWPQAEGEAVARLFDASCASWEGDTREKILEKWARIIDVRVDELGKLEQIDADRRRTAWSWVRRSGCEDTCPPSRVPVVVQKSSSYYLRVGDEWTAARTRDELSPGVLEALRAVHGIGVTDFAGLMAEHSQMLYEVRHSLSAERTSLTEGVLTVASAVRRPFVEPRRSNLVEEAIRSMAGPWAPQLNRWIGGLTKQAHPCRALILSGRAGLGKSLLIDGLARIWSAGYARMRHVLGRRFNDALMETPFAVSDDDETSPSEAGAQLATFLRQAVSDRTQKSEKKRHDIVSVDGCLRFAMATNDPFSLIQGAVSYKLNDASIAAFSDRLLHIPLRDECAGWWGPGDPGELVQGNVIAAHALWLGEQYVAPEERFWVGAADQGLRTLAVISNGIRSELMVYLAEAHSRGGCKGIREGEGFIYVCAGELVDGWLLDRPRGATHRTIGSALSAIAAALPIEDLKRRRSDRREHAISLELLGLWMRHCGL